MGADTDVPWQRVIASSGKISSRGPGTAGAARQRDALVAEGVDVTETRNGEFRVSWQEFGWFPERIQIEPPAADADDSEPTRSDSADASGETSGVQDLDEEDPEEEN